MRVSASTAHAAICRLSSVRNAAESLHQDLDRVTPSGCELAGDPTSLPKQTCFSMSIERSEAIRFHEQGTLNAVTRWIAAHDEGIAEWFKNVRRQYQSDRANVPQ